MKLFLVFCVVLLSTQTSSRSILDMENELALRTASPFPVYTAPALPAYAANIFAGMSTTTMSRVETTTGVYQRIANNIAEKLTTPIYRWFGVKPKVNPNVDDPYIDVLTFRRREPIDSEVNIYNTDENNKITSRKSFRVPLPGYVKHFSTKPPKERKNYLNDPMSLKVIAQEDNLQGKEKREDTTVESETKMPIEELKKWVEELKNKYKNPDNQSNVVDNNENNNIVRNPDQDVLYSKLQPTDNDSKDKRDENSNSVDAESKNVENLNVINGGGEVITPEDTTINPENKAENKKESVEEMLRYLLNVKTTESNVLRQQAITNLLDTTEVAYNLSTVFDMPSTMTTRFVRIRVENDDDLELEELGANEGKEITFVSILELIGGAIYSAFGAITSMFSRKKNNDQS